MGSAGVLSREPGWRDSTVDALLSPSNINRPTADRARIPNWGRAYENWQFFPAQIMKSVYRTHQRQFRVRKTHIMVLVANVNDAIVKIWRCTSSQQQSDDIQRALLIRAHQIGSFWGIQVGQYPSRIGNWTKQLLGSVNIFGILSEHQKFLQKGKLTLLVFESKRHCTGITMLQLLDLR